MVSKSPEYSWLGISHVILERKILLVLRKLQYTNLSGVSYRERYGEVITKSSPLIREQFDKRDSLSIKHPRRITEKALIVNLTVLLESVGIRTRVALQEGQKPATVRSEVPICNGFRRFFTSQCVNSDLNSEKRFLLEGHNLKFNDNSYVHVSDQLEEIAPPISTSLQERSILI